MKTAEDEAFDEIERRQGGGFLAKKAMAADKLQEPVMEREALKLIGALHEHMAISSEERILLEKAITQPTQEPVAFICQGNLYMAEDVDEYCTATHIPLYTTPPKREWVNLTSKQVKECVENSYFHTAWSSEIDMEMLVNNIEAALQKLNT